MRIRVKYQINKKFFLKKTTYRRKQWLYKFKKVLRSYVQLESRWKALEKNSQQVTQKTKPMFFVLMMVWEIEKVFTSM